MPEHLEVLNESHKHSGPGSDTHFRVLIVSSVFEGLNRVQRQQKVYKLMESELQSGVHALAQQTLTPSEWAKSQNPISSPTCASKKQ